MSPQSAIGSSAGFSRALDFKNGRVEISHGAGGRATAQLISELFVPAFNNAWLSALDDQAILPVQGSNDNIVVSTDGHVVSPLFFPGGDIGKLAVCGTVNDVAVAGARPLFLTAGFIIEEGFPLADLKRIVESMAVAAREAGVSIVTGDTKVVEKGKADGVFITTTGIGALFKDIHTSASSARPGDVILINGSLGDHGVAILAARGNLRFETPVESDVAALHGLVEAMVRAVPAIRVMRDLTRGGFAAALNEIARQSDVGMLIKEKEIPMKPAVRSLCEFLGLDPLHVANEGKLLAICSPDLSGMLLDAMRRHPLGREAAIVGDVVEAPRGSVRMRTSFGGLRNVDWLTGDQLPRIC